MRHSWTKVGALTAASLTCLAATARADIWGIGYGDNSLVRINPLTAEAEFVATLNGDFSIVDSSGLDYMNGTLYANGIYNPVDDWYGLVSIDMNTGATTYLTIDLGDCYALAGFPEYDVLFTLDDFSDYFIAYDAADNYTLIPIGIPTPSVDYVEGAAFGFGLFWGVDGGTNELYTIDPFTGALVFRGVVSAPVGEHAGLTWDNGTLYMSSAEVGETSSLYSLNPNTAEATLIGAITEVGSGNPLTIDGLAGTVAAAAPEPGTLALLAIAALPWGGAIVRRRKA
jgi:hypothetical protein